jgi:hypothetical protein
MLGVPHEGVYAVGHQTLDRGTSLLFYTDGLIEDRRRDITDGLSDLAGVMERVMASPTPLSAERTCAAVQAGLLGETTRADDVCLLAIRLTGLPGQVRSGPGSCCRKGYIQANQALESARDRDETVSYQIKRLRSSDAT